MNSLLTNKHSATPAREIFKAISALQNPAHDDMNEDQQVTEGYRTYEHICKDQNKRYTAAQVLTLIETLSYEN